MLRKIGGLGIALAVIMVPVMMAQNKPASRVTHATIGTIKQVDVQTHTIVVTPIVGTDQSYAFGSKTIVRGLPGKAGVPALVGKVGEKIVLQYAEAGEKFEALAIEYLGATEIQQLEGTVVKVDMKARTLTLKPASGVAEEFGFAPRALLDLKSGIVSLAQFERLTNVTATVFYSMRGKEKIVWYLQGTIPAVSLR
jgi:hypothetical protein